MTSENFYVTPTEGASNPHPKHIYVGENPVSLVVFRNRIVWQNISPQYLDFELKVDALGSTEVKEFTLVDTNAFAFLLNIEPTLESKRTQSKISLKLDFLDFYYIIEATYYHSLGVDSEIVLVIYKGTGSAYAQIGYYQILSDKPLISGGLSWSNVKGNIGTENVWFVLSLQDKEDNTVKQSFSNGNTEIFYRHDGYPKLYYKCEPNLQSTYTGYQIYTAQIIK